ncbi:AfsR/SARP family transcriptional regulator [Streptomyces sp. WAC 00631]|uniref:AfsR/SARP family transcriptional regulator n=1 Tax=Streptomyces TaxID=1883 RepID=UPI000F7A914C|nr:MULTISPECIES: AfsR/SARP family transcriptional regulator [Streptomyces]MCC3653779.1 AfsR/SARP family transcriptional regulator [Streptomyces sp. S07_1.15]MCC5033284.1 AfsR/SARP family transcriptional regulator [Streptomyces sp. WAC 00631]MCC9741378.1 AfsR/SARP family transcriptional regulator [Streptomyces sp. MNU89]WSQ71694.1 AfsR/SARP family transcriptional regulator [Streptomyces xinghaiensis]
MDIKVLGPLTAQERGISVVPTAAKPRQILALLALQADHVVTVPTLMQEIWGEDVPRSAATTLQTYILQLRRKIATALGGDPARDAKDVLVTQHGGYLLQVQPGQVDVQEFEQLAASGRAAHEAGDHRAASRLLRAALDLWQGPALVDVRVGSVLELEVLRMDEDRMAALERRIDADLRLGRHTELVPELRVLAARHPMHENFCAQLMLAMHRAGGAWRALEAYQRLRGTLVDELGMEPSPKLQQLHHAVLSGDPRLDLTVPAAG